MQVPTSQLLSEYLINTRDASAANAVVGKQRMDQHYTFLLSQANNHITERKKYGNLKDGQRAYLMPMDYIPNGLKMVRVYVGGKWTELYPMLPTTHWGELTSVVVSTSIPTQFNLKNEQGRMYLELDGVPTANAVANLEITYLGYQDPLTFPDNYATGTVSVENDSAILTGSGTTFTSAMIGRFIRINNGKDFYELVAFGSTTVMSMLHNYQEDDLSGASFVIAEVPRLPHEFHYTIMYGAVADYYLPKNSAKSKEFQDKYERDVRLMQARYQNKTQGSVTPGIPVRRNWPRVPSNYPNGLVT